MNTNLARINSVLRQTIDNIILRLDLDKTINGQLVTALAHLTKIDLVYSQSEEQLYQIIIKGA